YAQKQPKQEYKREAFELFSQLIDQVKTQVTRVMMSVQIRSPEQLDEATEQLEQSNDRTAHVTYSGPDESGDAEASEPLALPEGARVARNDPCPCGSGKKYKLCHGKLA
ncbi:MAG: SEC-C metal-binding domain-containing protein, partial [Comamonas sp.]